MNTNSITKHPIISGVVSVAIISVSGWLFAVGGFITADAYAEDQGKLDQIITLIKTTDTNQTSARKHEMIDAEITAARRRIEELEIYRDAAPDSPLAATRNQNIGRLKGIIQDAEQEKDELLRTERQARAVSE